MQSSSYRYPQMLTKDGFWRRVRDIDRQLLVAVLEHNIMDDDFRQLLREKALSGRAPPVIVPCSAVFIKENDNIATCGIIQTYFQSKGRIPCG